MAGESAMAVLSDVDGDLGGRLAAGCDAAVLEDLYDAYGAVCYQLARRVVAEPRLAHRIVQDVFVAVWTRTVVFDPTRASLHGWLLQVTHRQAVDAVRRNAPPSSRAAAPATSGSLAAGHDLEADASTRRAHVLAALAKLGHAERQVLELAYFDAHTQSEIAELTAAAPATVKTRTLTALRQLRENLAAD